MFHSSQSLRAIVKSCLHAAETNLLQLTCLRQNLRDLLNGEDRLFTLVAFESPAPFNSEGLQAVPVTFEVPQKFVTLWRPAFRFRPDR